MRFPALRPPVIACLALTLIATGCRKPAPSTPTSAPNANTQTFHLRGRVVSIEADHNSATIAHSEIPGFMHAMVMPYKFVQPAILSELHPGDMITADVLADKDADGYTNTRLDHIVVVGQAKPDNALVRQYHVPAAGDQVPDFALLNQSNKTIHLAQFKGKAILLTFIYTRCPLADYCPRMSTNFAEIDRALAKDPKLYAATHLLSISFDPTYDTPTVLRSYGGAHTGQYTNETFQHWDFAAPSVADLPKLEQFFDVGVTPGDDSASLNHSLSTVLLGKDGKVLAFYPNNDWKPADVLAQLEQAAK